MVLLDVHLVFEDDETPRKRYNVKLASARQYGDTIRQACPSFEDSGRHLRFGVWLSARVMWLPIPHDSARCTGDGRVHSSHADALLPQLDRA